MVFKIFQVSRPRLIEAGVKDIIEQAALLAPLHNKAALQGIKAAEELFKGTPQVSWRTRR